MPNIKDDGDVDHSESSTPEAPEIPNRETDVSDVSDSATGSKRGTNLESRNSSNYLPPTGLATIGTVIIGGSAFAIGLLAALKRKKK